MNEEFVVLSPSDFMIFGSDEKIDVLLSENETSLSTLLTNIQRNISPMVFNYEILVRGEISNISDASDLAKKGVEISDNKHCVYLDKDWTFVGKEAFGKRVCERYAKNGLVLESIIPVRKKDCCSHAFFG